MYIVIVCDHEITHTSYAICRGKIYIYIYVYIYIYIYICIKFYGPFLGMGCNYFKARQSHCEEKKFLVLIRSISERWKTEMTLKPFSSFELVYQPSYYQIEIKVTIQTDSFMTLNSELFQSEFSVLSGRLTKLCFLCTYVDQTIIQ